MSLAEIMYGRTETSLNPWERRRVVLMRMATDAAAKALARKSLVVHKPEPVSQVLPPNVDTRDLTARIFGDPLPGRSALDKRGRA
jgi:hypothetical protein